MNFKEDIFLALSLQSSFLFFFCHSLDPDSDPLCMLLVIDFLALRSREYKYLLQIYQEWEVMCVGMGNLCTLVCLFITFESKWLFFSLHFFPQEHRNLSQLPNFAFSTALCHFHLSQQEDVDADERAKLRQEANQILQNALIMFPGGWTFTI